MVVSSVSFLLLGFSTASASADQGPAGIGDCSSVTDVLTQSDGKTVVFAATGDCGPPHEVEAWKNVALRLDSNGERDPDFAGNGFLKIADETVRATASTPDGGFLVATENRILKFDMDGTSEVEFGGRGSIPYIVTSLAVSPGGKIVISTAGEVRVLLPDGYPDTGFNGGNSVVPVVEQPGPPDLQVRSAGPVDFAADGGILGAYLFRPFEPEPDSSPTQIGIGIFKLTAEGQPDPGFGGGDGSAPVADSLPESSDMGRSWDLWQLDQLDDGSLKVNGYLNTNADFMYGFPFPVSVSVSADGSSSSFGSLRGQSTMNAYDFAVSGDGTTTIAEIPTTYRGESTNPLEGEFAVGRFDADRNADQRFGSNGYSGLRLGGRAHSDAVALTGGGGVIAAGTLAVDSLVSGVCPRGNCRKPIIVARFDSAGVLEASFGDCGVASFPKVRWDRSSDSSQFHCSSSPLPPPKVKAGLVKKGSGRTLEVGIRPIRNQAGHRPWQQTSLKMPVGLRLRAGRYGSIKVRAGNANRSNRVAKKFITYRRSGLLTISNPEGESWKPLRVEVPLSSIKGRGKGLAGRSVRFKATYSADGAKKTVGYGRLRFPR